MNGQKVQKVRPPHCSVWVMVIWVARTLLASMLLYVPAHWQSAGRMLWRSCRPKDPLVPGIPPTWWRHVWQRRSWWGINHCHLQAMHQEMLRTENCRLVFFDFTRPIPWQISDKSVGERCPEAELPTPNRYYFYKTYTSEMHLESDTLRTLPLWGTSFFQNIHAILYMGPFAKSVFEGVIPFPSIASSVDWVDLSGHWLCSFLKRWRGAWVTRVV